MSRPVRRAAVEPLEGFTVRLEFTDGTTKEMDPQPYLHGPIFEPIRKDRHMFRSVQVDARMGTVVWDNGAEHVMESVAALSTRRAVKEQ